MPVVEQDVRGTAKVLAELVALGWRAIGLEPGAMVHGCRARHHTVRDIGGKLDFAAIGIHAADIAVFNAARLGIDA